MDDRPNSASPLTLTVSPKLDAAVQAGWEAWECVAREVGAETVAGWLGRRSGDPKLSREALPVVLAALAPEGVEERAEALVELAELAETVDELVADTLWEGVLALGREAADPDVLFEAATRLAAMAEAHGDPLAAAEYLLEFLNWRRQSGHASDPEQVEAAFDGVVRLAELDGAQKEAAIFAFRQAHYTRLLEAEDERAVEGDWEVDAAPYAGWA